MSQILKHAIRKYSLGKTKPKPLSIWLLKDSKKSVEKIDTLEDANNGLEEDIHQAFTFIYPQVVRDCLPRNWDNELSDVIKRFDKLCDHTKPNRTVYASTNIINAYTVLAHKSTPKNMDLAYILAWCFELSILSLVLLDDLLDDERTRWKKPAWHRLPNVGITVAADIKLLRDASWALLKKYFKNHPSYVTLSNLLSDSVLKTCQGQALDTNTARKFKETRDVKLISMNMYKSLVKYKTGYIVFKNPTLAAMYLANTTDDSDMKSFVKSLDKFTIHTQALNDVLDCYGNYSTFCRVGKDIENGKCTWLSATAIKYASQEQLKLFLENYGKKDLNCQEVVKSIYREIGLIEKYKKFKFDTIKELEKDVENIPDVRLHDLMHVLIDTYIDADEDFINNEIEFKNRHC